MWTFDWCALFRIFLLLFSRSFFLDFFSGFEEIVSAFFFSSSIEFLTFSILLSISKNSFIHEMFLLFFNILFFLSSSSTFSFSFLRVAVFSYLSKGIYDGLFVKFLFHPWPLPFHIQIHSLEGEMKVKSCELNPTFTFNFVFFFLPLLTSGLSSSLLFNSM